MRKRIGLLTAIVILVFPALAAAKIVVNRSIAGVTLGESKQAARKQLGPPANVIAPSASNQYQTEWVYYGRQLLVGFKNGHVVEVYTKNPRQKTSGGIGVGSTKAALTSHIKGVHCMHVKGFSGQECITTARHGAWDWTTDFHVFNGRVQSVLINILAASGGAPDRAVSARL